MVTMRSTIDACTSHDFIVFPWQRARLAQGEKGIVIKKGCLSFNVIQTRKSIDGKFSNDKLPPKRVRTLPSKVS